jgi:hypothetical protein
VAITRGDAIAAVHDRLSALATNAGFTAIEGSYGNALDVALRAYTGDTDITVIEDADINALYDLFEQASLRKLRNYYIIKVNTTVGPRTEALNQILQAIDKMIRESPIVMDTPVVLDELDISEGEESFKTIPNWFELGLDYAW